MKPDDWTIEECPWRDWNDREEELLCPLSCPVCLGRQYVWLYWKLPERYWATEPLR